MKKNHFFTKKKIQNQVEKLQETQIKHQSENSESIFPSSEQALKSTSENWPTISDQEILKGITNKMNKGERELYFFKSNISKSTVEALRSQGYKVKISELYKAPYFKISW